MNRNQWPRCVGIRITETFTRYLHDPDDPYSLSQDIITCIYEDQSGMLWIGTFGRGLNRMDRQRRTLERYLPDSAKPAGPSNRVWVVSGDGSGELWVGTGEGLYRLDRETGSFTPYLHDASSPSSLSNRVTRDIHADRQGRLWIASRGGGLYVLDATTGTLRHFNTGNSGLPSNELWDVQEDALGKLWLSTGEGLVRLDPRANIFRVYNLEQGLSSYAGGSEGFLTRRGELLFASDYGYYAVLPAYATETVNPRPPQVVLTDLRIFNEPVRPGPDAPLRESLSEAEGISLSHEEEDLTFGFAALHYVAPEKNWYAYMLEGYDDDWREVGAQRSATYTNLDPGFYVFRVKAANSDGV